jgi:alpha-beta hydrolase superfamily lysophospholipase
MKNLNFSFSNSIDKEIYVYKWTPETSVIKGAVQISHGLSETAARYEGLAEFLTDKGYIVYANDHLGHGKTAKTIDNLGYACKDGFSQMVKDMNQLNDIIRSENPRIPLFLFGHSMGSYLSQVYIQRYGNTINGVILSGTSGKQGFILYFGKILSKLGVLLKGDRGKAININKLTFGGFNKPFKPFRTEFDWISSDPLEVDKYIKDEYCGAIPSHGFYYDLFRAFSVMHNKSSLEMIPKDLPIYLFSGDKDPVGGNTKSVLNLFELYKTQNIKDLSIKFYKDGRHEMLNEVNKAEVMKDILTWLEAHI